LYSNYHKSSEGMDKSSSACPLSMNIRKNDPS